MVMAEGKRRLISNCLYTLGRNHKWFILRNSLCEVSKWDVVQSVIVTLLGGKIFSLCWWNVLFYTLDLGLSCRFFDSYCRGWEGNDGIGDLKWYLTGLWSKLLRFPCSFFFTRSFSISQVILFCGISTSAQPACILSSELVLCLNCSFNQPLVMSDKTMCWQWTLVLRHHSWQKQNASL